MSETKVYGVSDDLIWSWPCVTMRTDLLKDGVRYAVLQHGHELWMKMVLFKPGHSFYSPGGMAFQASAKEQEKLAVKYLAAHRCVAEDVSKEGGGK